MCTELAAELERLVEIYECMCNVQSGDPVRDAGLIEMVDIVVADLRSLLEDIKLALEGRPHVPIGFKLHAIKH